MIFDRSKRDISSNGNHHLCPKYALRHQGTHIMPLQHWEEHQGGVRMLVHGSAGHDGRDVVRGLLVEEEVVEMR